MGQSHTSEGLKAGPAQRNTPCVPVIIIAVVIVASTVCLSAPAGRDACLIRLSDPPCDSSSGTRLALRPQASPFPSQGLGLSLCTVRTVAQLRGFQTGFLGALGFCGGAPREGQTLFPFIV